MTVCDEDCFYEACTYFETNRRVVEWLCVVHFRRTSRWHHWQYSCMFCWDTNMRTKENEKKMHERWLFISLWVFITNTDTNLNTRSLAIKDDHK